MNSPHNEIKYKSKILAECFAELVDPSVFRNITSKFGEEKTVYFCEVLFEHIREGDAEVNFSFIYKDVNVVDLVSLNYMHDIINEFKKHNLIGGFPAKSYSHTSYLYINTIFRSILFLYFSHMYGLQATGTSKGDNGDTAEINPESILGHHESSAPGRHTPDAKAVGARLAAAPKKYAQEIETLADLFDNQVHWWKSRRPNKDDDNWATHHCFLKETQTALHALAVDIRRLDQQRSPDDQETVGQAAFELRENLDRWLQDAIDTIGSSGKPMALVAMITAATASLALLTSANPSLALPIATAIVGGPRLAKTVRTLTERDGGQKDTEQ